MSTLLQKMSYTIEGVDLEEKTESLSPVILLN